MTGDADPAERPSVQGRHFGAGNMRALWRRLADAALPDASSAQTHERAVAYVAKLPASLAINSVLALSIVGMLYGRQSTRWLVAWFSALAALNVARYLSVRSFKSSQLDLDRNPLAAQTVLRRSFLGALVCGLIWSLACAFLLNFRQPEGPLALIVVCGLTAGAALQGSPFAAAVLAMSTPMLTTVWLKLLFERTVPASLLSLDIALYQGLLMVSVIQSQKIMMKSIALREEATGLASQLKIESRIAREAAERFFHSANYDSLTGLANRACFAREFDLRLAQAEREGATLGLFLIDLDCFKSVNDTLGHAAGDEVLRELARRLGEAAGAEGLVTRLGGDEFAAVWRYGAHDGAGLDQVAQVILGCAADRVMFEGQSIPISLSVGAARFPEDAAASSELLTRADLALYAAKDAGRDGWRAFDVAMLETAQVARDVERDIPAALTSGALEVWFQPQVALASGALTGMECLIRWNHPRHGWIAPPTIVEAAFKKQACGALSALVLRRACEMLRLCVAAGRGDLIVAVNISPSGLRQYDLGALVKTALGVAAVDPRSLEIEITEDSLLDAGSIGVLASIAVTGVRLAIDDFGTGCASLAYLRELEFDRIKIDRCFVTGLAQRSGDQALVQAILGIGRALGVEVIAEGVETAEDEAILSQLGCQVAQGYYFGKAMPFDEFSDRFLSIARVPEARRA